METFRTGATKSDQFDFHKLLHKKWIISIVVAFLLVLIPLVIFFPKAENNSSSISQNPSSQQTSTSQSTLPSTTPEDRKVKVLIPTLTVQESSQLKADEEFYNREKAINDQYPWIKKVPIRTDKYFVYFDINKKMFIGLLYPTGEDNVDLIKAEAIRVLKEVKSIPLENYQFEWTVFQK